jgi:hypothetical protein
MNSASRSHTGPGWARILRRLPGTTAALWRNRQPDFPYQLAIGAIFKDEAHYLDEWLAFHHGVGVEHFYLYNNESSDNYLAVLSPWIDRNVVTLIDWPGALQQKSAYNNCLHRFQMEARWIAIIDIDEFLFSPQGRDLRAFLSAYSDLPAIFVYWHLFGSSGHVDRPTGSVIEAYTRRLDEETANNETRSKDHQTGAGKQGKSIVNPRLVRKFGIHTVTNTWIGAPTDENRMPPRSPAADISCRIFRINHYWSKSIADLRQKIKRGSADKNRRFELTKIFQREKSLNVVEDLTIQSVWKDIRQSPGLPRQSKNSLHAGNK